MIKTLKKQWVKNTLLSKISFNRNIIKEYELYNFLYHQSSKKRGWFWLLLLRFLVIRILFCEIVKTSLYTKSGEWRWWFRIFILSRFSILAYFVAYQGLKDETSWLITRLPEHLVKNTLFLGYLFLAVFAFVYAIGLWIIRTHDTKKQFQDSFWQQNETILSNTLRLLFDNSNIAAKSAGIKSLMQIRKPNNEKMIDSITSTGLNLKDAKLEKADLREVNLTNIVCNTLTIFNGDKGTQIHNS